MHRGLPIIVSTVLLAGCGEEQVDAYYYPNKNDLTKRLFYANVGSVENCRAVIQKVATANHDPNIERGDYECGVGPTGQTLGDITVYKQTVR